MKNKNLIAQGMLWVAWITFLISLLLPFESHTLPFEVSWCSSGPAYCGYQSAAFFAFSPAILFINLFQSISTAILYPEMLRVALSILFTLAIYSVIGLGQFLVVLAPIWPRKIKKPALRRLHLWIITLATLSAIVYGLVPDMQQGVGLLIGYFSWVLSFIFLLAASSLMCQYNSKLLANGIVPQA